MKAALAILLVVVVAGVAECATMGQLRADVQERLKRMRGGPQKQGGEGGPKGGDRAGERPDGDEKPDWPFGWIEFTSLLGKCITGMNMISLLDVTPSQDSILTHACPHVIEGAMMLKDASEEDLKEAQGELRKAFPLMQCVNLQADREGLMYVLTLTEQDPAEDPFLNGAAQLFGLCQSVFESVAKEMEELEGEVEAVEEDVNESKRASSIQAMLRQLLNAARK